MAETFLEDSPLFNHGGELANNITGCVRESIEHLYISGTVVGRNVTSDHYPRHGARRAAVGSGFPPSDAVWHRSGASEISFRGAGDDRQADDRGSLGGRLGLPRKLREVLLLNSDYGLSMKEMADILQVSGGK